VGSTLDGILNIDKPAGRTSYSVVAAVKRLAGERRVGHAGTLDPDATGVLPVCLGQATRIIEFFTDTTKTYRAVIELGIATDTYDASGKITQRSDPSKIDRAMFESALVSFRGAIRQTPPMYSAVKQRGQPLYKLARAGVTVERKPRPVTVHRLELIAWQPPSATLEIECSKGTYIRSLAHELGQTLGCGAHLKNLMRTRSGIFDVKNSVSQKPFAPAMGRITSFPSISPSRTMMPLSSIAPPSQLSGMAVTLKFPAAGMPVKSIAAPTLRTAACWACCVMSRKKRPGSRRRCWFDIGSVRTS
jgi:tRNA pseudouridine55 synthase